MNMRIMRQMRSNHHPRKTNQDDGVYHHAREGIRQYKFLCRRIGDSSSCKRPRKIVECIHKSKPDNFCENNKDSWKQGFINKFYKTSRIHTTYSFLLYSPLTQPSLPSGSWILYQPPFSSRYPKVSDGFTLTTSGNVV